MITVKPLTRASHVNAVQNVRRGAISTPMCACAICGKGVYHSGMGTAYVGADTEMWTNPTTSYGASCAVGATVVYGKADKPEGAIAVTVHAKCVQRSGI